MNKHLKKVPTFLVIGLSGYAAWPILFPEPKTNPPPAAAAKPPTEARPDPPETPPLVRNPFKFTAAPPPVPVPGSPSAVVASTKAAERSRDTGLPEVSADDEAALAKLRLTGTFIEGPRRMAVIDGKVYALGESLLDREGAPMPYAVKMVHADRVVLRRERRDFVLEFPERPKVVAAKPDSTAKGDPKKGETPNRRDTPVAATRTPGRNPTRRGGGGAGDEDQKDSVMKLLTGLMGQVPGASGLTGSDGGLPSGVGGSLPPGVNSTTLSAGIDALMGKLDNIGRTTGGGNGP